MAQTIKIKRSSSTTAPTSLASGELAYSTKTGVQKLYYGDGTDVLAIGGKSYTDKLDGIEAGATADQTDAQIRAAVEAASDSNVFTDADHTKLDLIGAANGTNAADASVVASANNLGVIRIGDGLSIAANGEVSADEVTSTSVTNAGALMDSEVTNLAQVKAFSSADYATAAQGTLATNALPKSGGTLTGNIVLGDNNKAQFGGTTTNLEIYHSSGNAIIAETGAGSLILRGTNLSLQSDDNDQYIQCVENGGVTLYHQYQGNSAPKLETTASGIDVSGTVEFNGLSGTGSVTVTDILDQDNMSSNSATSLATQQSIKAYVDNATTMGNFTFTDDEIISSGSTMTLDPHADGSTGTVVVNGNLEVKGVTTTIDSTTVTIADNYIQLNSAQDENSAPPNTMFCGIQVDRGSEQYDSGIYWVESSDEWVVNTGGAGINRLIHDSNFEAKYPTLDGGTF